MPCVSGRTRPIACIQPGSESNGTLTPQKSRKTKIMRFAKKKTSRPRRPNAPIIVPNAVQDDEPSRRR